ncbi:MAG TPA: AAA family ATPase [Pirellulales bacterium]|jgi:uncharacterized protein YhaN|nr:AAA family ATPase [Pirellulales bacterium]
MKIRSLEVDGFGVWQGLRLDRLAEDITVIYGPNEAGKTTLMQFVRAMLYGFTPERRARYLPPLRGGRGGGLLRLALPRGEQVLSRHDDPLHPVDGQVRVAAPDGAVSSDSSFAALLANVDEPTFRNVFAVGMREIQQLGSLSDTAAAEKLYRVATGLGRISLAELLRELTASRNRLFTPDAPTSQIVQLAEQCQRLTGEIEQLRELGPEYVRLKSEHVRLDDELLATERQQAECDRRVAWLERAAAVRDPWHRRAELRDELAHTSGVADLPADAIEQFEALTRQAALWHRRAGQARRRHRKLKREIDELAVSEPLVRQGPRIEALIEQRTWLGSLAADVERLQTQIDQATKQLAEEHQALGIPRPSDGKRPFDPAAIDRLKPAYQALREAHRRRIEARSAAKAPANDTGELKQQIDQALEGRGEGDVHSAVEQAGTLVAKLRRRVQIDERLAEMSRQQAEVAGQGQVLVDQQLLPTKLLIALGAVFVVGAVLVLAGLLFPGTIFGDAGWGAVALGVVATVTAMGIKFWVEYSAEQELQGNQQRSSQLTTQIEQTKAERDALDKELPRGGGPLLTRLAAAEKELAELEKLLPLHAQHTSASRQQSSAKAVAKRSDADWQAAHERWRKALASAGLPQNLTTRQMREFRQRRDQLEELGHAIVRHRQELADRTRDLDTMHNRVAQVAADAGVDIRPFKTSTPIDVLDRLQQLWTQQQQLEAQRVELHEQMRRTARQITKAARRFRTHRDARRALLRSAGVRHERQLRERVGRAARLQRLRQEHDVLVAELNRLVPADEQSQFEDYFARHDVEETHRERAQLADRRDELQHRTRELAEERGRATERMAALTGDRRAADRRLELATVDQQLREALERWQVLGLTHQVITDLRRRYETDQQPEALREASQYFARLTDGAYRRIWTPVDEDVLRVDDAAGNSLAPEVLSRGTREQLFLSLRLALVALFARHGAPLPMVLDDVLVNFDAARARRAAEVLREFAAKGHQLLIFTCHEHIAELFRSLGALAIRLPSNAAVGAAPLYAPTATLPAPAPMPAEPAPASPPPRRRRPRPAPERVAESERVAEADRIVEPEPSEPKRVVPRPHAATLRRRTGRFVTSDWHEEKETVEVAVAHSSDEANGHES